MNVGKSSSVSCSRRMTLAWSSHDCVEKEYITASTPWRLRGLALITAHMGPMAKSANSDDAVAASCSARTTRQQDATTPSRQTQGAWAVPGKREHHPRRRTLL